MKKLLAALFILAFSFCLIGCNEEIVENPLLIIEFDDGNQSAWAEGMKPINVKKKEVKFIYFGNYMQNEVTGTDLTSDIINADYDSLQVATVNGVTYKQMSKDDAAFVKDFEGYYDWSQKSNAYFVYAPIKWRVLSIQDGKALLMCQYGLDALPFDSDAKEKYSWADCTLRAWLDGYFKNNAFNETEQSRLQMQSFEFYQDVITLPSPNELINEEYGFTRSSAFLNSKSSTRHCHVTDYAKARGAEFVSVLSDNDGYARAGDWWNRATVIDTGLPSYVDFEGLISLEGTDAQKAFAVRPMITIDVSDCIKQ